MAKQTLEQAQAQERAEEQAQEQAQEQTAVPVAMTADELAAAHDRHVASDRAHALHERRMGIINTGTGEPPASPTPTWHPLDVPQPQTARPVEPTPHTVPFDAQR